MKIYEASSREDICSTLPSSLAAPFFSVRETHHVFDFSSSVFHSIFIVAVLLLFVLFVVGLHQKWKKRKRVKNEAKDEEFSFVFFSFSFGFFRSVFGSLNASV